MNDWIRKEFGHSEEEDEEDEEEDGKEDEEEEEIVGEEELESELESEFGFRWNVPNYRNQTASDPKTHPRVCRLSQERNLVPVSF